MLTEVIVQAINSYRRVATDAAGAMEGGAQRGDQRGMMLAAERLNGALDGLWALRETRDVNWQTILNHAQGMMAEVAAEDRLGALTTVCGQKNGPRMVLRYATT